MFSWKISLLLGSMIASLILAAPAVDKNSQIKDEKRADFTNNNFGSGNHVNNNGGSANQVINSNMDKPGQSGTLINGVFVPDQAVKAKKEISIKKINKKRADFTNNNFGPGNHVNNNGISSSQMMNNNMGQSGQMMNNNMGQFGQSGMLINGVFVPNQRTKKDISKSHVKRADFTNNNFGPPGTNTINNNDGSGSGQSFVNNNGGNGNGQFFTNNNNGNSGMFNNNNNGQNSFNNNNGGFINNNGFNNQFSNGNMGPSQQMFPMIFDSHHRFPNQLTNNNNNNNGQMFFNQQQRGQTFTNNNGGGQGQSFVNNNQGRAFVSKREDKTKVAPVEKKVKRTTFTNNNVGPGDHVNNNNAFGRQQSFVNNNGGFSNGGFNHGQSFINNNGPAGSNSQIWTDPSTGTTFVNHNGNNNGGQGGQSFVNNNQGQGGSAIINNNNGQPGQSFVNTNFANPGQSIVNNNLGNNGASGTWVNGMFFPTIQPDRPVKPFVPALTDQIITNENNHGPIQSVDSSQSPNQQQVTPDHSQQVIQNQQGNLTGAVE